MQTSEVAATVAALGDIDVTELDREGLEAAIAQSAKVRGWLDAFNIRLVRRGRELQTANGSEPAGPMFGRTSKQSTREGERTAEREGVGSDMPSFENSLGEGEVSSAHLDAIADARRKLDAEHRVEFDTHEAELLVHAKRESVDGFARRCRELARRIVAAHATSDADELDRQRENSTVKRWVDKITGMCNTKIELDPVRDAALWSAIDSMTNTLRQQDGNAKTPWTQLQIDALLAVVGAGAVNGPAKPARNRRTTPAGGPRGLDTDTADTATAAAETETETDAWAGDDPAASDRAAADADDRLRERRVPEITIVADFRTIVSGLHDQSICETEDGVPLPVSTVRRLCCDAEVFPVMLDGNGVPLDLGRSARTVNRAQRRALRAIYRTCAHPDCTMGFSACKIHHIRWWWKHMGRTDIDNLIPLCKRHHHLVHEGCWELTMTPDRVATWTRPDGSIAHRGPSANRVPCSTGPPGSRID